jgi:hypothetical protein
MGEVQFHKSPQLDQTDTIQANAKLPNTPTEDELLIAELFSDSIAASQQQPLDPSREITIGKIDSAKMGNIPNQSSLEDCVLKAKRQDAERYVTELSQGKEPTALPVLTKKEIESKPDRDQYIDVTFQHRKGNFLLPSFKQIFLDKGLEPPKQGDKFKIQRNGREEELQFAGEISERLWSAILRTAAVREDKNLGKSKAQEASEEGPTTNRNGQRTNHQKDKVTVVAPPSLTNRAIVQINSAQTEEIVANQKKADELKHEKHLHEKIETRAQIINDQVMKNEFQFEQRQEAVLNEQVHHEAVLQGNHKFLEFTTSSETVQKASGNLSLKQIQTTEDVGGRILVHGGSEVTVPDASAAA